MPPLQARGWPGIVRTLSVLLHGGQLRSPSGPLSRDHRLLDLLPLDGAPVAAKKNRRSTRTGINRDPLLGLRRVELLGDPACGIEKLTEDDAAKLKPSLLLEEISDGI